MSLNAIAVNQESGVSQGVVELPEKHVAEGNPVSESFLTAEIPVEGKFRSGVWVGQPGKIKIANYPADEVFTVVEGRIDMINEDGSVVVVKAGQSGQMRKGWNGVFHIVEPAKKCFAAVG